MDWNTYKNVRVQWFNICQTILRTKIQLTKFCSLGVKCFTAIRYSVVEITVLNLSLPSTTSLHFLYYFSQLLFTLSVDHTQLTINVSNKNIVGVYECRVTTVQGQASTFINISLPGKILNSYRMHVLTFQSILEPPVVQVEPSNRTVLTGGSVSFECLVNGTLPYTIQWLFGSATILPLGVSVLGNTQLVINSANRTHTGSYVCVVSDEINEVMATAVLLV